MAKMLPNQKFGYIDIKQSSKVRPRKLKSWKRRWAVLTQMSNLLSDEYVAKLDLYDSDTKWRSNSSDKMTLLLENVTNIRHVKSKTHQHAFEVVEDHPVLVISGATELESYSWILSLQQIFTPDQIEAKKDCYEVTISPNEHSETWSLSGVYNLTVCPTCIRLAQAEGTSIISWGLNTLIKFNVKQNHEPGQMDVLIIECGPNAPTGQGSFHFLSKEAEHILMAIRQSICLALALKQSTRSAPPTRQRTLSATVSEKGFQKLLDSYTAPQFSTKNRSDSTSSGSNVDSLTNISRLSSSPVSPLGINRLSADRGYFAEIEENIHAQNHYLTDEFIQIENAVARDEVMGFLRSRSSSHPDRYKDGRGYSEIKDVSKNKSHPSRRITLACEPVDYDINKLRSVSNASSSLRADTDHISWRFFPSEQDDKSDLDSAISSLAPNDDSPKTDVVFISASDCMDTILPPSLMIRRRSSSTPDLQAYRKLHENVYEELDELRVTGQRLNMVRDSDVPPELPARRFSAHFVFPTKLNTTPETLSKSSTLNWFQQARYDDFKQSNASSCTCKLVTDAKSSSGIIFDQCSFCDIKTPTGQKKENSKASKNEMFFNSSLSADVNAIILQVQNLRPRRSSDVTPVSSSLVLSSLMTDASSIKASQLPFQAQLPERCPNFSAAQEDDVFNRQGDADIFDLGITVPDTRLRPLQDNQSDLLIQFSDETFN